MTLKITYFLFNYIYKIILTHVIKSIFFNLIKKICFSFINIDKQLLIFYFDKV